jgi:hypothetical protein
MPRVNTPISIRSNASQENIEIAVSPTSYPWRGGAPTADFAPGDMVLFTPSTPREESEWLREIMHEYGHVALPPIDNFAPPLEPFANGVLGETLGALWAAGTSQNWQMEKEFGVQTDDADLAAELQNQVEQQALPALQTWQSRGPLSPLRRNGSTPGLQYLQGLAVYIERTYGANVLGAAFSPLNAKNLEAIEPKPVDPRYINTLAADAPGKTAGLTTDSLVAMFALALRNPFDKNGIAPSGVLPVWLPGALEVPNRNAEDLIARSNLKLKVGVRMSGWLFMPSSANVLHLEWKGGAPDALSFDSASKASAVHVVPGANGAADLDLKNRNGWQRISLLAKSDLEIVAAQFEK